MRDRARRASRPRGDGKGARNWTRGYLASLHLIGGSRRHTDNGVVKQHFRRKEERRPRSCKGVRYDANVETPVFLSLRTNFEPRAELNISILINSANSEN